MNNQQILGVIILLLCATACRNARSTCEEAQQIQCEFTFRCCEDDERYAYGAGAYVTSEGECAEQAKRICAFFAGVDESIAAGRSEFDAELADTCINQAREKRDSCDPNYEFDDECSSAGFFFAKGLVEDGDTCATSFECADGGDCVIERNDDYTPKDVDAETGNVEGECVVPPGEGDACPEGTCQSGLYCDFTDNTCKAQKENGEPCADYDECESYNCDFDTGECAAEEDNEPDDIEICDGRK
jgi:hypothetical protein